MLNWILNQFKRQSAEDLERAREMVKAAERGHSHPDLGKARDVARTLGIEVDVHASAEQLIQQSAVTSRATARCEPDRARRRTSARAGGRRPAARQLLKDPHRLGICRGNIGVMNVSSASGRDRHRRFAAPQRGFGAGSVSVRPDRDDHTRFALPLRKVEVSLRPVATAGTARRRVGRDDGAVALRALGSGEGVRGLHPRGNVAFAVQYAPDIDVVRAFDVKDQVGVA